MARNDEEHKQAESALYKLRPAKNKRQSK